MAKNTAKIALAATFGFALAFTLSCSGSDDPDNGSNGGGEGLTLAYGIENVTDSSFTIIEKSYECRASATLNEEIRKEEISYSINKTLSLGGIEFSGNSASLAGVWTREAYSVSCGIDEYDCEYYNRFSKAVFTQNSVAYTRCLGRIGERDIKEDGAIVGKEKIIDCGTLEITRGTETGRVKYSGTEFALTYNGKTCKAPRQYSESKMREVCSEAYNKAVAEGNDDYHVIEGYYSEILNKDIFKCIRDNKFPEWFH
jgi:hypothetical protein